jgi:hypothetical protein
LKSETKPKRESLDLSALGDSLAPEAKPQAKPKRESLDLSALSNSLTSEAKPQSRPRRDRFDLNALASSLDRDQKPSAATRGPSRSQTALTPRVEPGVQQATNDAAKTVGARLNRIWNKSCSVPGFRDQVVQVTFNLNIDGSLSGDPHADGYDPRAATVREGAIERALTAVRQAAPFRELPRETYGQWKHFTAIFNGREACQNQ